MVQWVGFSWGYPLCSFKYFKVHKKREPEKVMLANPFQYTLKLSCTISSIPFLSKGKIYRCLFEILCQQTPYFLWKENQFCCWKPFFFSFLLYFFEKCFWFLATPFLWKERKIKRFSVPHRWKAEEWASHSTVLLLSVSFSCFLWWLVSSYLGKIHY